MLIQFRQEQPVIFNFVYDTDNLFELHEREFILFTGVVVWQLVKQIPRPLRQVTQKNLEKAHKANFRAVDMMITDSEADFNSAALRMIEQCRELELFQYINQAINGKEAYNLNKIPVLEDHRPIALIHLKTVLDALISALA